MTTRSKPARGGGRPPVKAARTRGSRTVWLLALVVALAVGGLAVIYRTSSTSGAPAATRYDVGAPGIGALAPDFTLPNATRTPAGAPASPIRLSEYRGKTVLLYFHEGLGCQPCWDQIRDLQKNPAVLAALGVDQLLTITSGPADLITQKMSDEGLSAPALADTNLQVSTQYEANRFGMMGTSRDGHSFILVGPDGRIEWRADYGGPPKFTMYVPVDQLAADLHAGRKSA